MRVLLCQIESELREVYSLLQHKTEGNIYVICFFLSKTHANDGKSTPLNLFTDISRLKLMFLFAVIQCISKLFFFSLLL